MNDRRIHCQSNVWSTAQIQKNMYGYDVCAGVKGNHRSVAYGKQCSLARSCLEKGIRF